MRAFRTLELGSHRKKGKSPPHIPRSLSHHLPHLPLAAPSPTSGAGAAATKPPTGDAVAAPAPTGDTAAAPPCLSRRHRGPNIPPPPPWPPAFPAVNTPWPPRATTRRRRRRKLPRPQRQKSSTPSPITPSGEVNDEIPHPLCTPPQSCLYLQDLGCSSGGFFSFHERGCSLEHTSRGGLQFGGHVQVVRLSPGASPFASATTGAGLRRGPARRPLLHLGWREMELRTTCEVRPVSLCSPTARIRQMARSCRGEAPTYGVQFCLPLHSLFLN
ncbi:hypothetical protein VPH35_136102 [Triticum aestivum]